MSHDPAKSLTAKFKNLRKKLKEWNSKSRGLASAINNNKLILQLLDTIESFRDLTIIEWNFRERVCTKLISLLKQQRSYWRQRGKINWVKEGDASTRYFHAHATIRHRKNSIATLQDAARIIHANHEDKAKIL